MDHSIFSFYYNSSIVGKLVKISFEESLMP